MPELLADILVVAECIYHKRWLPRPVPVGSKANAAAAAASNGDRSAAATGSAPSSASATSHFTASNATADKASRPRPRLKDDDDAKLIFGTVFSLRNIVRKLAGQEDNFISYRTGHYKLHYYETPTCLKFVMITDTKTNNLRVVLHQIYVNLFVEYVVKNPLSPVEHAGGVGVANELFELALERFVSGGV